MALTIPTMVVIMMTIVVTSPQVSILTQTGVVVDDGGIKNGSSAVKSALDAFLSEAERFELQAEVSDGNEEKLIIYSPGGDVFKAMDNLRSFGMAARNANDGVDLSQILADNMVVSDQSNLTDINIEIRNLDDYKKDN